MLLNESGRAGVLVHHRQHVAAGSALGVVGGALVRVLAVRQGVLTRELGEQPVREGVALR